MENNMSEITALEVSKIQRYLQETFGCNDIALKLRSNVKDSAEVLIKGEFIGVVYKDEDEGETSYNFDMAILELDLPAN